MSHSYLQKKTWLLLNRKYIKKTKLIRVCIFKIILKQSPKCFTIVKTSLRGNDHSELTSWPERHPVSWQYVYLSPYFQAMQLKLHSGSFIEQLHSSSITWSHCAIAWTKCSQEEKKKITYRQQTSFLLFGGIHWLFFNWMFTMLNIDCCERPEKAMQSFVWRFST